jgi:diacylglycerol kinase (ATP)
VFGNRLSGRGRGARVGAQLEQFFNHLGIPAEFFWPQSREEMREWVAAAAAGGHQRLVIVGGDGTLVDVLNAVSGGGVELGLVPAGDANDVARALGLPRDPLAAAQLLTRWATRAVDLVRARLAGGREHLYLGAGGAGLDAEAARLAASRFRLLPGVCRYLAGALLALGGFQPFELEASFDDRHYCGRAVLAAVANAPAYGGGIRIAPEARIDDGWLDAVVLEDLGWFRALAALPALLHSGEIRGLKLYRFRARRVSLVSEPPVMFHGDGELLGPIPVELEVLPGAQRIVCPLAPGREEQETTTRTSSD